VWQSSGSRFGIGWPHHVCGANHNRRLHSAGAQGTEYGALYVFMFFSDLITHGVSSYFSKLDCAARVRLPRAPPRARTAVLKKWACHLRLCVLCGCACVRGFKGKRLHIDHCAYVVCARGVRPSMYLHSCIYLVTRSERAHRPTHRGQTWSSSHLAGVGGAATRAPQTDTRRRAQLVRGLSLAACYRISLSLSLSLSLRVPCPASPFLVTLARSLAQSALSLTL
jgi:hypothetical protein